MAATKIQLISLAVVSILTIIGGISVFVLFKFTFDAGLSDYGSPLIDTYWPYGIPVLISGVLGLIASIVKKKAMIGSYLGFGIVCLIVFGVFIGIAGYIFFYTASLSLSDCYFLGFGPCACGFQGQSLVTIRQKFPNCEEPPILIGLSQASCAVMVLTWLLMLSGLIISCTTFCCGNRDNNDRRRDKPVTVGHELQPRLY